MPSSAAPVELKDLNPSIGRDLGSATKALEDFVDFSDASTIGPTIVDYNPHVNSATQEILVVR